MTASEVADLVQRLASHLRDAQGNLTPLDALAQVYATAQVRTAFTPEVKVDFAQVGAAGGGGPGLLVRLLRPTVVLEGPEGRKVLAPAGEAPEGSAGAVNLLLLGTTVFGSIFLLGYWLGRAG